MMLLPNTQEAACASISTLQVSKGLMKQPFREQIRVAMKAENEEFSAQVRSEDDCGLVGKAQPDFTRSTKISSERIGANTVPVTPITAMEELAPVLLNHSSAP